MSKTITVSDIAISKDSEGRFSLKDLHEAAGKERRHEPSLWIRLEQTKEIIEEIKNTQICVFSPIAVKRGCKGGTYVCKELVYSYAMWISASFSLKVIRAYDEMVTVHTEKKTTVDQRTPLRDAINMLVSKKHLLYPEAYALIHQRFNVEHIDELPSNELPTAIEYVHKLALEGEYIPNNANALNLTAAPIKGIIALHFDGSGVIRTEFVPEGATVATLDQFESLVRHRGGVILWDDLQQREFVRERAMLRL